MKAPLLHYKAFTQSDILVKSQSSLTSTWRYLGEHYTTDLEKLHPSIPFRVTHCLLKIFSGLKSRGTLINLD